MSAVIMALLPVVVNLFNAIIDQFFPPDKTGTPTGELEHLANQVLHSGGEIAIKELESHVELQGHHETPIDHHSI